MESEGLVDSLCQRNLEEFVLIYIVLGNKQIKD